MSPFFSRNVFPTLTLYLYGSKNYPLSLEEIARVLVPGGQVILVESDLKPITESKQDIEHGPRGGALDWVAFWEQYKKCLAGNHIDTTVPSQLLMLLRGTGAFEVILAREACYPVGFWNIGT